MVIFQLITIKLVGINSNKNDITKIAYELYFNDPAWFSRACKEKFGFARSAISK